jgi:hypothetical protein
MDFLSAQASPGYIQQPAARVRVHYICGGVMRSLMEANAKVLQYGSDPCGLDDVEQEMREEMMASCEKWMKEVGPEAVKQSTNSIADLMRGTATWHDMKPAYDQGLVALHLKGRRSVPVSSVAASVLHQALARHVKKDLVPLETVTAGKERGNAFEAQLHAVLDCCREMVRTRTLDGSPQSYAVRLRTDYSLPFLDAMQTVSAATTYVLYLPKSDKYPCDAIIVPPVDVPDAPVVLVESSVTHPTEDGRLEKLLRWFKPALPSKNTNPKDPAERKKALEEDGGFIDAVKAAHPERKVVAVLCWLGRFDSSDNDSSDDSGDGGASASTDGGTDKMLHTKKTKKQLLLEQARDAGIPLCVLDLPGLEILGIRMKA